MAITPISLIHHIKHKVFGIQLNLEIMLNLRSILIPNGKVNGLFASLKKLQCEFYQKKLRLKTKPNLVVSQF